MPSIEGDADIDEVWDRYHTFSGRLAYDIGANGGQVADVLCKNFNRVIAFEPAIESFFDLERKEYRNVELVRQAVSDQSGTVELLWDERATGRFGMLSDEVGFDLSGYHGDQRMVEVPTITLDDAVEEYSTPDFIKCDVEGHEMKVFEGGKKLFENASPELLIEVHKKEYGPALRKLLPGYEWDEIHHGTDLGLDADPRVSQERKDRLNTRWANFIKEHFWIVGRR